MLLHLVLLAQLGAAAPTASCEAQTAAPALDHAILVVRDLDRAAGAFRRAGFRIKAGRLHPNGLLNGHIKFPDGTEIELMTVRGRATDDMAQDYAKLMAAAEGGVYVALKTRELVSVERQAASLRLGAERSSSGPWQFLSFAEASAAAAVFFTVGEASVTDADSIFQHQPRIRALIEVWVEGGAELGELLRRLGAAPCGEVTGIDGRTGQRWALRRGSIVVVASPSTARPRVLGAVVDATGTQSRVIRPIPQFWIEYR